MQRALAMVAVAGALLLPLAAAQGADEATYRIAVQDLFPERDDLDVGLEVAALVYWRLASGTVEPGAALDRAMAPLQGPLEVQVQYRVQRACCPEQSVQGMRALHDMTPLGDLELEPLELDAGQVLVLRLRGALRAALSSEGPGEVAPTALAWDAWEPQALQVEADAAAPSGGRVAVRARSIYALDVDATLDEASGTWQGQAPADAVVQRTYTVASTVAASRTVPGPEAAASAMLVLAVAAIRR